MGAQISQENEQKKYLKVANLNFSGQESSPFEYFSHEHILEEQELNNMFQNLIESVSQSNEAKNLFSEKTMKKLSKIDKVLKSDRYSPLYNKNCGILNGKFVNIHQFKIEWIKTLQQTYGWKKLKRKTEDKINKSQSYENFEECIKQYQIQLNQLRAFDYLVYVSILRYVYEHTEIQSIIKDRACNKYRGFMQQFFSKTYLSTNKKIIQTINFVIDNDIDVLFVQEATQKLCNQFEKRVPDYRFIMSKQTQNDPGMSVVIFKQSAFSKSNIGRKGNLKLLQISDDKKIPQIVKQKFLSWGKCSFISIDNFILISCLSSVFTQQMQKDLKIIHQKFPSKYVIVGGTLSSGCHREHSHVTQGQYQLYPTKMSTCYKKRTQMQFQKAKAGSLIISQTNFILYDKRLKYPKAQFKNSTDEIYKGVFTVRKQQISIPLSNVNQGITSETTINNNRANIDSKYTKENVTNIQIDLLPSQQHPFDQLIVLITLKIPRKRTDDKNLKKLTKQEKQRLQFQTSSSEQEEKVQNIQQAIEENQQNK